MNSRNLMMLLIINQLQAFTNMFDQKEQEIIQYGLQNGKSKEEVQGAISNYRLKTISKTATAPKQTFGQDFVSDVSQIGTDIKSSISKRAGNIQEIRKAEEAGQSGLRSGFQSFGQTLGGAGDIIGSVFKGVVKAVLPQEAETAIKTGIQKVATPVVESDVVKRVITKYNSLDPALKRDIDASLGIASFGSEVVGGVAGAKALKQGLKTGVKAGVSATKKVTQFGGQVLKPAIGATKKVVGGVKDIAEITARGASKIPGRIATNVDEGRSVLQALKALPTKTAQTAVQSGIDISDVKFISQIPTSQKNAAKALFSATKKFTSGTSKTNPIELVGKPITDRINQLKSSVGKIGQKLGQASEKLGTVSNKELTPMILESLKKVPGLRGLKMNSKGILDFSDTNIASSLSLSDQKVIQKIFTTAVKSGTGKQKHLLRQELFEILGGKKKSLTNMTATQDQAFQAVRRGLSDVLDTKNSLYKSLNAEYAKTLQPLNDIERFLKLNKLAGASDDILNMKAGLIARRLTSNAVSNPEIRNVLRMLDNVTKVPGKTSINVETLQDFFNILDKYYPITGKTTLQGQLTAGIEKARGLKDVLAQTAERVAGKTDAVKRKAFEDLIRDTFIGTKSKPVSIIKKTKGAIPKTSGKTPIKNSLAIEAKKYKTTVNIQDKNDLEYLGRILSEDNIKDIKAGKTTNFRGIPYEDLAKVNIISEAPKTIDQQLAGKIKEIKLKSDTFYHGTSAENAKGIMSSGFKKGSELSEDTFRGGGYGKIQNSISFSETSKEASRFSSLSKNGEIIKAKLKPNSKVVSIKGIEDATDLEDYIDYLRKQKIDAVYIGGGEKELVVINSKAVIPTKSQLTDIYNKAKK